MWFGRIVHLTLGVSAAGGLAADASAALLGMVSQTSNPPGSVQGHSYLVMNVWAAFSDPSDRLLGITEARILVLGPFRLFQHPSGADTAPDSTLFPADPSLQFDSFVSIGLKLIPPGGADTTVLDPGSAFVGPGGDGGFQGGWFNSDPRNDQGAPVAVPELSAIGFFVLIAQLSFQDPGPTAGAAGDLVVVWQAAGATGTTFTAASFISPPQVPAVGALPLLVIAGLAPRRRR